MHPRSLIAVAGLGLSLALMVGCTGNTPTVYRNALTGAECTPNPQTYIPRDQGQSGQHGHAGQNHGQGNTSPTGIPGDNLDDIRSGKVDCLGDGNSGQGNDPPGCQVPGCDDKLCCDGDMTPPPNDGSGDDGSDHGDAGSGDDGSGHDGSGHGDGGSGCHGGSGSGGSGSGGSGGSGSGSGGSGSGGSGPVD